SSATGKMPVFSGVKFVGLANLKAGVDGPSHHQKRPAKIKTSRPPKNKRELIKFLPIDYFFYFG
ncbi:MAG: hypothetical protein COU85_02310, partial [Candidatus Portnoybacteria bacterium CG10_big_fil_rev_8_21_14_0_10_44_7]